MANRRDYYFRQKVTEDELDQGFNELEKADRAIATDAGIAGVLFGLVVGQHSPTPDLTIDLTGPGAAYDQNGQRIYVPTGQVINCAVDSDAVSTSVAGVGNERYLSIFANFDRALSDPRTDGNAATVQFVRDETFEIVVVQGSEAAVGLATKPSLSSTMILLADIHLIKSQTQIVTGDISTTRRHDRIVSTSTPRSLRRGRVTDALGDLLTYYNNHVTAAADKHAAADITYAGGGAWADGTTNPATTVELQLDKIVANLVAAAGAERIGAAGTTGTYYAVTLGSVKQQIDQLLTIVDAMAKNINPDGAATIGAKATGSFSQGTVRSQLDYLDTNAVRVNVANAFSQPQSINSGADTTADLLSTRVPTTRKLLWTMAATAGGAKVRFYVTSTGGFEITQNAAWTSGSTWARDDATDVSSITAFVYGTISVKSYSTTGGATFSDSANIQGRFDLNFPVTGYNAGTGAGFFSLNGTTGVMTAPGAITVLSTMAGQAPDVGTNRIGAAVNFPKLFPSAPSSHTFTNVSDTNISVSPAVVNNYAYGFNAFATCSVRGSQSESIDTVLVS